MLRTAAIAALLLPSLARAELGGSLASVEADRGRMGARLASHPAGRWTHHELTRPNGGAVRELTNARGEVFAVTWDGPGKPDLRAVLGRYFAAFQQTSLAIGRVNHGLRRPVQVAQGDLKIVSEGHGGVFRGAALVPSLAPAGFTAADLPGAP